MAFAVEIVHGLLEQCRYDSALFACASRLLQRLLKVRVCRVIFFSAVFEIAQGKQAGAFAGCISDLACQLQGPRETLFCRNGISQELIYLACINKCFDQFTLQPCLLINLFSCGIFSKCVDRCSSSARWYCSSDCL